MARAMRRSWMPDRRVFSSSKRSLTTRRLLEDFRRVDAIGVPEQESLRVVPTRRPDLRPHLFGGAAAARQREVLEPRNEHRLPAAEGPAEIPQRVRDRRP